jgi:hypothetical protein
MRDASRKSSKECSSVCARAQRTFSAASRPRWTERSAHPEDLREQLAARAPRHVRETRGHEGRHVLLRHSGHEGGRGDVPHGCGRRVGSQLGAGGRAGGRAARRTLVLEAEADLLDGSRQRSFVWRGNHKGFRARRQQLRPVRREEHAAQAAHCGQNLGPRHLRRQSKPRPRGQADGHAAPTRSFQSAHSSSSRTPASTAPSSPPARSAAAPPRATGPQPRRRPCKRRSADISPAVKRHTAPRRVARAPRRTGRSGARRQLGPAAAPRARRGPRRQRAPA